MNIATLDYILRRWTTERNGTTGAAAAAVVSELYTL
jgi:hypothetical protein